MVNNNKTETPKKSTIEIDKSAEIATPSKIDTLGRVTSFIDIVSKVFGLLTWPVVALIVFMMFYTPIRQMAELLPKKFAGSSEISIGGLLSLKIQEEARTLGNEELATIISGLSQEEIKKLITLGGQERHRIVGSRSDSNGVPQAYLLSLSDSSIWKSLIARGLVKSNYGITYLEEFVHSLNPIQEDPNLLEFPASSLSDEERDELVNNYVELTDTGKKAYDIIISVIVDLIGEQ